MKRFFRFSIILAFLGLSGLAHGAIFNVAPNGGSDCNAGLCDLQSALDAATINGEDNVLNLAAGVYSASNGTFKYEPAVETGALTLKGDPGGGTIIDGSGVQAMSINTLGNPQNPNPDSLSNISISHVTFQGGVGSDLAGGLSILTHDASAVVDHCKFLRNKNVNTQTPPTPNFAGGGLSILSAEFGSITVTNSEFRNNGVSSVGGGAFLLSVQGDMSVQGNNFIGNFAGTSFVGGSPGRVSGFGGSAGGAFALAVGGSLTVDRNDFSGNSADSAAGGLMGLAPQGSGAFTNNILLQNSVMNTGPTSQITGGGGALLVTAGGALNVGNNTIVDNRVGNGDAGGLFVFVIFASSLPNAGASVDIYNNIVFDNAAAGGTNCLTSCDDIFIIDTSDTTNPSVVTPTVNVFNNDYSDISFACDPSQGCVPHQNIDPKTNFSADPLFVSAGSGDVHLLPGSPAIDAGTAFGPVNPTVDFDGKPRNQGKSPDLGALEFSVAPTENCANGIDDDGDGKIDCADPDCSGAAACISSPSQPTQPTPENCTNGVDDDGDGNIDCNDPDCAGSAACQNTGTSPTSVSAKGCAMTAGGDSPTFLAYLVAPLILMTRRFFRKS